MNSLDGPMVAVDVALFDWDRTLRRGFTLFDWASLLARHGAFDPGVEAELSELASQFRAGVLSYRALFDRAPVLYAAGLRGQAWNTVFRLARVFVDNDGPNLYPFATQLSSLIRDLGMTTAVISGAPVEVLRAYQSMFSWTRIDAVTVLAQDASTYGGTLVANPATAAAKAAIVASLSEAHNVVVAFGDSESDLPMLNVARFKVVVDNPELIPSADDVLHLESSMDTDRVLASVRDLLTGTPPPGDRS